MDSVLMVIPTLLLIITICGGMLWTYFYEKKSSFFIRLIEGAFVGQVVWGLAGFITASFSGLTLFNVIISVTITVILPLLFVMLKRKNNFISDFKGGLSSLLKILRNPRSYIALLSIYILLASGLWLSLSKGVYSKDGGIYPQNKNNYSDFTPHAGIINGFGYGNNFPPQHPDYAGSRLTYPFLTDFITAMLVVAGLPLVSAIFLQSFVYLILLIGLLHLFVRQFSKSNIAAVTAVILIFFNGGLGWILFFREIFTPGTDMVGYLMNLPHDYSSFGEKIRWGNSIGYWFIPMRSMLLGIPLVIVVVNIWWRTFGELKKMPESASFKSMAGAGIIAGLLPLVHGHSLLTIFIVAPVMALIFRKYKLWAIFFVMLLLFSLPQFIWMTTDSEASAKYFFGFIRGWNQFEKNI